MEPTSPSGAARVCRRRAGQQDTLKRPRSMHGFRYARVSDVSAAVIPVAHSFIMAAKESSA